ncbi:MAG: hypothetical protein HY482_02725 [Candidatus Wildermuthbacteria bacterium]|nr:hypothetical protein [Candidatus Wildermuthbacteria bacterium]
MLTPQQKWDILRREIQRSAKTWWGATWALLVVLCLAVTIFPFPAAYKGWGALGLFIAMITAGGWLLAIAQAITVVNGIMFLQESCNAKEQEETK